MKKIVTIVGARPQFIKAAAISEYFIKSSRIKELIVHTGQHYDTNMSENFFKELDIPKPAINLEIGSGLHGEQTGKMLINIEKYLLQEKPDLVIVYGDTNSTIAGALTSVKLHIPVAHIEAGLRSFNNNMPEEINRILTDRISDLLFAPTETAVANIKHEGVNHNKIFKVGDVMFDAALRFGKIAEKKSNIIEKLNIKPKQYILTTIHRAENTDSQTRLTTIIEGLNLLSKDFTIVFPIHPRTKKFLNEINGIKTLSSNILLIEPVGYLDMISLEKNAALIATDSGGVQKEAYFYKTPCITLRDETEWVELVKSGWNKLVSPLTVKNVSEYAIQQINFISDLYEGFYGDGKASEKIFNILNDYLEL